MNRVTIFLQSRILFASRRPERARIQPTGAEGRGVNCLRTQTRFEASDAKRLLNAALDASALIGAFSISEVARSGECR